MLSCREILFWKNQENSDEIYNDLRYMRDEIELSNVGISAARFFQIDRSLIINIFGSVLTYLIVMLTNYNPHKNNTA